MKLSFATVLTILTPMVVAIPANNMTETHSIADAGSIRLCPSIVIDRCFYENINSGKCVTMNPTLQKDLGTINFTPGYVCFFYPQAGCDGDSSRAYNSGLTVMPDPRATRMSYRCVSID